jgi:hypothetical protein
VSGAAVMGKPAGLEAISLRAGHPRDSRPHVVGELANRLALAVKTTRIPYPDVSDAELAAALLVLTSAVASGCDDPAHVERVLEALAASLTEPAGKRGTAGSA